LRVLVADDHPTNRAVIEIILQMVDATSVSVQNGEEALLAFKNDSFDVVLMDLQMPVMDGLSAIRKIREHEGETAMARTPVLAVTANVLSEHVAQSMAAGADRHIPKPVTAQALLAAIYDAVDRAAEGHGSEVAATS
jgi:CheY-like chemotaxis protein